MGFFDGILHRLFGKKDTQNNMTPPYGSGWNAPSSAGTSQTPPVSSNWLKGLLQTKPRPQNAPYAPRGGWLDAVEDSKTSQASTALEVYDRDGTVMRLGDRNERGSGGEGTVYALPMNDRILVKIYKDTLLHDARKMDTLCRRIADMVRLTTCEKMTFLAWPVTSVLNARKEVIGFAMRKCTGKSLLALRGPRFIKQNFPGWTRRELALTALDYVKKVEALASQNVLVNDFNPANFLVNDKCEVSFIDCDSYQIPAHNGGAHITRTFFPSHVAPELLLNKSLLERPRNIHQVEFGTALTVFHILMCGLHPYNYYDPKHKSACGTPDENLMKGRCPLGKGSDCLLPRGWYNLWSWLPFSLKSCFIKMFKDGHANPDARPSLKAIESGLEEMLKLMQKEPERMELEPMRPKPSEQAKSKDPGSSGHLYSFAPA